jgi:hypothetical protein
MCWPRHLRGATSQHTDSTALQNTPPLSNMKQKCPQFCLCLESTLCCGPAVSSTRAYVMDEYQLRPDPCDNQLVRFSNCLQIAGNHAHRHTTAVTNTLTLTLIPPRITTYPHPRQRAAVTCWRSSTTVSETAGDACAVLQTACSSQHSAAWWPKCQVSVLHMLHPLPSWSSLPRTTNLNPNP